MMLSSFRRWPTPMSRWVSDYVVNQSCASSGGTYALCENIYQKPRSQCPVLLQSNGTASRRPGSSRHSPCQAREASRAYGGLAAVAWVLSPPPAQSVDAQRLYLPRLSISTYASREKN